MINTRIVYQMKISKIIDHTPFVRELRLTNLSPQPFSFRAGQFAMLHVPDPSGGKPALRAYSISSEENRADGFDLIFKYVDNGKASSFVWNLKGDETLSFTGPFGKVFFQEPPTEQIVFLNTGTGITQHMSFLLSKKNQYPHLKYRMLFGLRHEKDIYFREQLLALKKELSNFEFEYVLSQPQSTWTGKKGYVQNFVLDFDIEKIPTTFYLCGNGSMIKATKDLLINEKGIDKSRVWAEAFD